MASRIPMAKESTHGGEKRTQNQQGGSGSLWSNQDEMRRYVSKLKSELAEQKNRVKRVHRDRAEEIKRLQENLDNEKQKAIENVSKKLESDKAYELKKMKESVVRQKESELRQVLRVKDDEMRALKQELQESRNTSRTLELENKRIVSEQGRSETNEPDRRWKSEISSLRSEKRRLEESLRIKSEADFEKAELIRKMKQDHDSEIRRLTRESKRESLKELRQLRAASREVELKNNQLAAKEADLKRLEKEKNHLGNELNSQRRGSVKKSSSFNSQKAKGLSVSQNSESDFDNVAEEKIKKLKMRNSELVAIARKLEEKAKQLQEEKDLLERSNEVNNPEVGNLKKAFARQRARDLAERAKLVMNKDNEINNLKKEVEETRHNGFNENGCAEELEKIVHQTSKEHLLLEKQVSQKIESLTEEIKDLNAINARLANDNEILKERVFKLQDLESKNDKILRELKETRERNAVLEDACSEKDKRLYQLELEKQAYTKKNDALQKKNDELLCKINQLNKVEQECCDLKENVGILMNENRSVKEENARLRSETENLSAVKKDVERLQEKNITLEIDRENVIFKLEERDKEILSLHEAQKVAQRKYSEEVSGLEDMVRRLKEQQVQSMQEPNLTETPDSTISVVTSTPKDTKCTQTSRPSSPVMSPIILNGRQEFQRDSEQDEEEKSLNDDGVGQNLLTVPYNGTSSSTSFDLENAGTRIQQLAVSDSDEIDWNGAGRREQESSVSSAISEYSEEASGDGEVSEVDTSYSADVSQASDTEEPCADKTLQDEQQGSDYEDPRNDPDMYIGSPLQDLPDLEEKLSIFIAKYNYDPMLYSPNENPEMELAFQAGDYLYVYGDVDEDGFYVGELMNGERGLVPSNFVEQIAEDEAILQESGKIDDDFDSEERRHEWFRSSLDHVLTDQLGDIRESDEDDLGASSLSEDELGNRKNRHNRSSKPEADQVSSEGFESMDSDVPEPRIPSPTKLSLDRQFTSSALISWRGAQLPNDEIQGYNIYVDGKFKTQVKGSKKTNAVVEDIKPTETYRLSVRTKSVTGMESPDNEATMIIGPDAPLSPSDVQMIKITTTSGQVHWLPAHSSYRHEIFLNETLLECIKPGCTSYTISNLSPATLYQVQVRTLIPEHLAVTLGKIAEEDLSAEVEFTTSDGGLPEPPVDLRLAQRMSDKIILTWLPVTLSQDGYSNGYKVSGYKVYVNDVFCMEIVSACVDNVAISMEHLKNLGRRNDFSLMRFVVRTLSVMGESVNSNVVDVGWDESQDLANLDACSEVKITDEQRTTNAKESAKLNKANLESECARLEKNSNIGLLESDPRSVQSSSEASGSECISLNNVTDEDNDSKNLKQASLSKGSLLEQHTEPDRTSIVSKKAEVNCVDKDAVEGSLRLNTGAEEAISKITDGPAMIVRKPPIVTRYEDLETESESNSTESKTQDTEEELIERFEQLEISQKNNARESNEDVKEIPGQDSIAPAEHPSETSKTKESNSNKIASGRLDSDLQSSEKLDPTQQELRNTASDNSEKRGTENVSTLNVQNSDASGEAKTRNDENNKPDSTTETEAPPNSPTAERYTESETDSENQDERRHAKGFQTLVQNATSLDGNGEKQEQLPTLSGGPLQSESETDTEYGPPLSVIDEVDEDNLTDTNNPQRSTGTTTSDGEATLSNKQIKSLPADSSKSSDLTATRSRTATSDDEGFRTEDDVLDLLDDDDDDDDGGGGIIKDLGKNEGRSEVNKDKCEGACMVNKGDKSNDNDGQDNRVNNDTIGSKNGMGIVGDMSVKQSKNDNSAEENSDSLGHTTTLNYSMPAKPNDNDCVSKPDTVNSNMQDNNEALTNGHTTEDESSENLSASTCPTRTSFKSDSSMSEDPPAAEYALETIMATLSLPSNRGMTSGESDHGGNMLSGSEQTSGVISERNRSESEVSENVSEPVRYFVALYSYDPSSMSPNENGADEELPFNEGDIIKVFGEKDDDGFFWGQCKLKQGFVPSNMIAEMNVTEAELLFNQANSDVGLHNELNSRGQVNGDLDVDVISDNIRGEETGPNDRLSFWENLDNDNFEARKMKALYDYDPAADSPNVDSEVELKFKAGEIIFVFGDMDDDGFFKGELNGMHGLVPSNFLQPIKKNNHDGSHGHSLNKLNSDSTMSASLSPQERQPNVSSSNNINHGPADGEIPAKKKKNIFSKGKKIFKKAFK